MRHFQWRRFQSTERKTEYRCKFCDRTIEEIVPGQTYTCVHCDEQFFPLEDRKLFAFQLVFDEVMLAQLKKLGSEKHIRDLLAKLFDKMQSLGPRAGELVDSQLGLYEMKVKHPPIRLYYRHVHGPSELQVFEYEMKTSPEMQKKTIGKLRQRIRSRDPRE